MGGLTFTGQFQRSRMPRKRQVAGHNGTTLPPRAETAEPWVHPEGYGEASQVSGHGRSEAGWSPLQQYPASRSPADTLISGGLGGRWLSTRHTNRVRNGAAEGTLSSWSNEIRPQDALHLFAVSWDEEERAFTHIGAAAVWQQEQAAVLNANLAAAKASDQVESRRSVLGMKGGVAQGPNGVDLPMTNAEKARAMGGGASSGPIQSAITERAPKEQRLPMGAPDERAFAELMTTEGVRGEHRLVLPGASAFAFLQQDEDENGVFYYEQQGAENPAGTGFIKWRLKCSRENEWHSAAPRAYGPGRHWGGAWGGDESSFSNTSAANAPGMAEKAGGRWEERSRFVLSAIDENPDPAQDFFYAPQPGPTIAGCSTYSPALHRAITASAMSQEAYHRAATGGSSSIPTFSNTYSSLGASGRRSTAAPSERRNVNVPSMPRGGPNSFITYRTMQVAGTARTWRAGACPTLPPLGKPSQSGQTGRTRATSWRSPPRSRRALESSTRPSSLPTARRHRAGGGWSRSLSSATRTTLRRG
ncbi:hypothetical protein T484DRAFT_1885908 [Baffinella frigidus]|nr:hypothetical protein T484DRAFT_1885908 [Cryptophyta sp. CCMP2293]